MQSLYYDVFVNWGPKGMDHIVSESYVIKGQFYNGHGHFPIIVKI